MTVLALEVVGAAAILAGLALLLRRKLEVPQGLRWSVAALLTILLLQHVTDIAELLGVGWADAVSDLLAGGLPFVWAILLLQLTELGHERRSRQQQKQVASLIKETPASVAVLDQDGRLLRVSDHWSKRHPKTEVGKALIEVLAAEPEGLATGVSECLAGEGAQRRVAVRSDDGGWWDWSVSSWSRGDDSKGVLVILEDRTDEVEAELRRDQEREELAQAQRLALIGELAAGTGHDLNNLLTVLRCHMDLLQMADDDPKSRAETFEALEQAFDMATELTKGLLRLARPTSQEPPEDVDVARSTEHLVRLVERTLPRHVDLDYRGPNAAVVVRIRPSGLQQILLNLVVNARDAVKADGGSIVVEVKATPEHVELRVSDDGPGIPSDVIAQVFSPFFTTKGEAGTGLGLSVVRKIAEAHAGTVDVSSPPGRGARFIVRFPRRAKPSEALAS